MQGDAASIMQRKPKLVLTKPKTPEFVTSHRVRPVTVKSTAELDEEMMAKIPKFKARPLNKKVGMDLDTTKIQLDSFFLFEEFQFSSV